MKLTIDKYQGDNADGNAFGYIGSEDCTGYFFDWPTETPRLRTAADREAIIATMALDTETSSDDEEEVPYEDALQALTKLLDRMQPDDEKTL